MPQHRPTTVSGFPLQLARFAELVRTCPAIESEARRLRKLGESLNALAGRPVVTVQEHFSESPPGIPRGVVWFLSLCHSDPNGLSPANVFTFRHVYRGGAGRAMIAREAADLDVLVDEWRRWWEASHPEAAAIPPAGTGTSTGGEPAAVSDGGRVTLDRESMVILKVLADSDVFLTQIVIAERTDEADEELGKLDRGTVGDRLRELEKNGYVDRPKGERKGYIITAKGRALIPH